MKKLLCLVASLSCLSMEAIKADNGVSGAPEKTFSTTIPALIVDAEDVVQGIEGAAQTIFSIVAPVSNQKPPSPAVVVPVLIADATNIAQGLEGAAQTVDSIVEPAVAASNAAAASGDSGISAAIESVVGSLIGPTALAEIIQELKTYGITEENIAAVLNKCFKSGVFIENSTNAWWKMLLKYGSSAVIGAVLTLVIIGIPVVVVFTIGGLVGGAVGGAFIQKKHPIF